MYNSNIEKRLILKISFIGNALFLLSECVAAFLTHSQAVLTDCIYDLVDLAMLGPFMILVPLLYKPVTEKWPYGLAQIESLFIIIKYSLLLFLDVKLMTDSIQLILSGGHLVNAGAIAAFELLVSVSCVAMYFLLKHLNRGFSSPTVKAELYIWKLDAYSTAGVGLASVIQLILQKTTLAWIVPYIDPSIAIFMALILIKEPIVMIWDAFNSLILLAPKKVVLERVRELSVKSLEKYHINVNFLDMVKTGRTVWVDVYISQEKDLISIKALKLAHDEIIKELKRQYENVSIELIPEIE
ncbi:MAG: cation diffusion facilitator family transporter [Clostridiales bacterium]|nr:cation diffusion facilitator family transporter [Clostridiales bacterium]